MLILILVFNVIISLICTYVYIKQLCKNDSDVYLNSLNEEKDLMISTMLNTMNDFEGTVLFVSIFGICITFLVDYFDHLPVVILLVSMVIYMLLVKCFEVKKYKCIHDIFAFMVFISGGLFTLVLSIDLNDRDDELLFYYSIMSIILSCLLCLTWLLNWSHDTYKICNIISVQDIYAFLEILYFIFIQISIIRFCMLDD